MYSTYSMAGFILILPIVETHGPLRKPWYFKNLVEVESENHPNHAQRQRQRIREEDDDHGPLKGMLFAITPWST